MSKNLHRSFFNGEPTLLLRNGTMNHSMAIRAKQCQIFDLRLAFLSSRKRKYVVCLEYCRTKKWSMTRRSVAADITA